MWTGASKLGTLVLVWSMMLGPARADDAPPIRRQQVRALMKRTADWQLAHLPARTTNSSGHVEELLPTNWVRAAFQTGLMAAYEALDDRRYLDTLRAWSARSAYRLGPRYYHADDHCVGQTYLALYRQNPDARYLAPLRAAFDSIRRNPQTGPVVGWEKTRNWSWCDALFMAPPVWAELARTTGDRRYLDFMNDRWWETHELLFDKTETLYYRDDRFVWKAGTQAPADSTMVTREGGKILWSRGNGWVVAGLVRVLSAMPAEYPTRPRFERLLRTMLRKIVSVQRPDGLWTTNLMPDAAFPAPESSGSAFFCYALAWGLRTGVLSEAEFGPALRRGWQGLSRCVSPEGKLGYAQRVGHRPVPVSPDDSMEYATGALLLAGRELLLTRSVK
jgi:unsaturated rhamnogalacturonyl hydrolase